MRLNNQQIKLENIVVRDNFKKWYQTLLKIFCFVVLFSFGFYAFQNKVEELIRWILKVEIPNNYYVENLPFWTKIIEDIKVFFEELTFEKILNWIDEILFWISTDGLIIVLFGLEIFILIGLIYDRYLKMDEVENLDEESGFRKFLKDFSEFRKEIKQMLKEFLDDYFEEIVLGLFLMFWPPIILFLGHFFRAFLGMTVLGLNNNVIYDESLYTLVIFVPTVMMKVFLNSNTFFKCVELFILFYILIDAWQSSKIRRLENRHYAKVLEEQKGEHSTVSGIPGSGKTLKTVIDSNIMEEHFFKEILEEKNDIQASDLNFNYHKLEEVLEKDEIFAENYLLFEETRNVVNFNNSYIDELEQEIKLTELKSFKDEEEYECFIKEKKKKIKDLKKEIEEQNKINNEVEYFLNEKYKYINFEDDRVKRYLFLELKFKKSLIFSDFPVVSKFHSLQQEKLVFANELTVDELTLKKGEGRRLIEEFYIMILDEYEVAIGKDEDVNKNLSKLYSIISHVTKRKYKTTIVTQKRNAIVSDFRVKMDVQHSIQEKVVVKFGIYKIIQNLYLSLYKIVKNLLLELNYEKKEHHKSEQFIYTVYNKSLRILYSPLSKIYIKLKCKLEKIEIEKGYFVFSYENLVETDAGDKVSKNVVKKEKIPCKLAYININGFYYRLYDSVSLSEFYQKKGRYEFYLNTSPFISTSVDKQKFYDEKNLFNGLTKINNDKVRK